MKKIIYKEEIPCRLDVYLANCGILPSRTAASSIISKSLIKVNEIIPKKSLLLVQGDIITIEDYIEENKQISYCPENIPLDIVYEDEHLLVINKQSGLVVHPSNTQKNGTLVNALLYHYKDNLSDVNQRFGIVHRLDKDTTGAIIVAKDNKTHLALSQMFKEKLINKYYLAITCGNLKENKDIINNNIARSRKDRKKMSVAEIGKESITHYEVIKSYHHFDLLKIKLETGRTHQIRVQFSHLGNPILGDITYSSLKTTLNKVSASMQNKVKYLLANHLHRQALHSFKIDFEHPISKKKLEIYCKLPKDFLFSLKFLKENFLL